MPVTVAKPGTYPVAMLDQREAWVGLDGFAYAISSLGEDDCLWALDYSLVNSKMLRDAWAFSKKESYDDKQRPRRWMLQRPGIRALLRRLVEIEDE